MLRTGEGHRGNSFFSKEYYLNYILGTFRKIHVRLHCNLQIFVSELWQWLHMLLGGVTWMIEMGFMFAIPSIKVYDVVQEIGGSSLTCFGLMFLRWIWQVALLDGVVMGGGNGISIHGKFRVATENTVSRKVWLAILSCNTSEILILAKVLMLSVRENLDRINVVQLEARS